MKLTHTSMVGLAALLQVAKADFILYRIAIGGNGVVPVVEGWQVYNEEASCGIALDWLWRDSDDVSGNKYGVRCEGDGCSRTDDVSAEDIELAEMNFNSDDYHWTYYKDRGGDVFDLDDNLVGSCEPTDPTEIECVLGLSEVIGYAKLKCTMDATADDINGNRPVKRSMRHVRHVVA